MSADVQQKLEKEWLPQLRQLHTNRRPIRRLMIAVLIAPFLLFFVHAICCMVDGHEFTFARGSIAGVLLGLSALCFYYLGKLQECSDSILVIDYAVIAGDEQRLYAAIGTLTCYGSFRNILEDARNILPKP